MSHSNLISGSELLAILGDARLRVLDARSGKDAAAQFAAGHIPGAVHVSLDRDLAAPHGDAADGGRHPLPEPARFAALLGGWGVTPATRVVAVDDQGGANAAARLWWMLRALGHADVQVLDGGIAAAVAAGVPSVTAAPEIVAAPPYPARGWRLPLADIAAVDSARRDPGRRVLDVRAGFRYRGESEPFDPVAGHIPGARNAPYAASLDDGGRFRPPAELRARFEGLLGGVAPDQAIVHCGSGVTACHTLLALEEAGLPGAALYVGSWSEWCRRPACPIATGDEG